MKIYIVTSGIYSDYMIDAVFLDKDKARKYSEIIYNAIVEEYDTKDDNLEVMIENELYIKENEYKAVEVYLFEDEPPKVRFFRGSRIHSNYAYNNGYETFCYKRKVEYSLFEHDKIKEKAIKAAYDLRAFARLLKAEGYTAEKINELINKGV